MSSGNQERPALKAQTTSFVPPYSPSWFDRLTDSVDQLPVPAWLIYLLFGVLLISFEVWVQWREGGRVRPAEFWTHGFLPYELLLIHYLDKLAANSLAAFQPLLKVGSSEPGSEAGSYQNLLYRLTTLPPWPTAIAAILGTALALMAYFWIRLCRCHA